MKRSTFFGAALAVLVLGAAAAAPSLMNAQQTGVCPTTYYVTWGDTLYKIGVRYNVWWTDIALANNLANPDRIYPGQQLTIPCPPGVTPAPTPTPIGTPAPQVGPPPGCLISDGNACYGPGQTCATEADWRRGKETCLFLGLGSNEPPVTRLPVVYGGYQLMVNGHLRGGYENDSGHVCGILILIEGEPRIEGVQVSVSAHDIGIKDATRSVKRQLRGLVDCSGGFERSTFDVYLGPREYP